MSATITARRLQAQAIGKGVGSSLPTKVLHTILAYQTFIQTEEEYNRRNNEENGGKGWFRSIQFYCEATISQAIPTIFGLFINLLDACTFGSVFFPAFMGNTSHLVVELFLLSTLFSQVILIYYSSFQSALGTSMAENIPFVHSICDGIYHDLQNDPYQKEKLLPTALVAVSLSVVLNGLLFIALGVFHLGNILHFFPRYVIIGLNAGFGVFLIGTAFEISTGLPMAPASFLLLTKDMTIQVYSAAFVEIALRVLSYTGVNDIIISLLIFSVPIAFFLALCYWDVSFSEARDRLWLFPETEASSNFHWYNSWDNYMQWQFIDWKVIAFQFPTIGLLALFTIVLVPVRIPSLSFITNEEVVFDEELIAQGIGNVLSGIFGCPHNYLSYSNSIFYFILKGKGKNARLILCLLTFGCFFIGSSIINYTPRIIASLIMIHLGVDLLITAFLENNRTLTYSEFFCMLFVCLIVVVFGFVMGMCVGILLACVTFVVASSNEQNIRAIFLGNEARSDTQWSPKQEEKLSKALDEQTAQIFVIELQGHLFFGNVQRVITQLQEIIDPAFFKPQVVEMERRYSIYGGGSRQRATTTESSTTIANHINLPHPTHFSTKGFQAYEERFNKVENITKLINVVLDCTFLAGADINALTALYKLKEKYENYRQEELLKKNDDLHQLNEIDLEARYGLLSHSPQFQIIFAGLLPSLQDILEIIEKKEKHRKLQQQKESLGSLETDSFREGNTPLFGSIRESTTTEERQALLSKESSSVSLTRLSRKLHFQVLKLKKSFYFDVNSALHVIEEELLRVLPDSIVFQSQEQLIQVMDEDFQLMLNNGKKHDIEDYSSDDFSDLAELGERSFDEEEEGVHEKTFDYYTVGANDLSQKLNVLVEGIMVDDDDIATERPPRIQNPSMTDGSHTRPISSASTKSKNSGKKNGRTGRAFSKEDSEVGSIKSPSIQSIRFSNQRKKKLIDYFHQLGSNLWKDYDLPYLEELAMKLVQFPTMTYHQDEIIWMKGSEANELGVLIEGKICQLLDNGKTFQAVLAPSLLGLSCVVKERTRTRTLVAVEDGTKIIKVPLSFIEDIEEKNRPLHSILVTMALRGLYYRQKSDYSLFHAGSVGNLMKK